MVSNIEFGERLKKVMDYYGLTATALADSIGIQRSSISHLLSGRNKPSLDFVLKLLQKYPEVELYWLLNGKGNFPNKIKVEETHPPLPTNKKQTALKDLFSKIQSNEEIEKIVIFYKDGSFKDYSYSKK